MESESSEFLDNTDVTFALNQNNYDSNSFYSDLWNKLLPRTNTGPVTQYWSKSGMN